MTKKDYELIANAIDSATKDNNPWQMSGKKNVMRLFCEALEAENPSFNAETFISACCKKHA
tara:strand:+ start:63 stop:245 length:183 start_codon:yes stop_codon:yes gene_type:complete